MKQIYIIDYESSQWCGGGLHCLVMADSEDHAEMIADNFMEDTQRELFGDHYDAEDSDGNEEDCAYTVNSTELLAGSEHEKYAADPSQESFYPKVNF